MTDELNKVFEEYVSNAVRASLLYARSEWISKAQENLTSTRADYIDAISDIQMTSPYSGYIELKGKFPQMLEMGFSSFDMKQGFEKSPKKTETPNGWYLTIPYRHRTSGSVGVMPNDIKKQANRLGSGESLSEKLVAALGYQRETSKAGYTWKNRKYDNLNRIIKKYPSGASRSQYITFRRVSNNTDTKAWIHPGYKGLHALNDVVPKTERFIYDYMKG